MDLESSLQHLSSKPLLGYQLDASHLHTVLQNVLKNSQQQVQALNGLASRVQNIETHVENLNGRVGQIENALGKFGGAEELAQLRNNVAEIAKATDQISHNILPAMKKDVDTTARQSEQTAQALQPVTNAVMQLEQQDNNLKQDIDALNRGAAQTNDSQRQIAQQVQQLLNDHQNKERSIAAQQQQAEQQLRDMAAKADRLEKDVGNRLGNQLEDLNKRTNDNFMQVEQSARAVDAELNKIRTDVANVRAELNTLDNDTRFKFGKVTDDVDGKFNMLLQAMQSLERNSTELDSVLIEAGRALANNKRSASAAPTPMGTPNVYGSTTTTTTALGGDGLHGRVDRQGSAARGGSANNFRML